MPGKFPDVLEDKIFGVEAARLYADAKNSCRKILTSQWFTADGVIWILASIK
jgi:5-methyltetrahydrofolate--homocysteine methyltransferase